jgi:hypothetical protein
MPPDQKVDANTVARASFAKDIAKSEFAIVLSYKLQRKKCLGSNDQSNMDSVSTEDTSTSLRLLVIWGFNDNYGVSARALLIKHNNTITWNEDTLKKLHSMYLDLLGDHNIVKNAWLLDDATVLMTASKCKDVGYPTKITISEVIKEDDSMEPIVVPSSIVAGDNV